MLINNFTKILLLLIFNSVSVGSNAQSNQVDLLFFNASQTGSIANISWAAITEKNTKYYSIQKSLDNINYITIGVINAAGNSTNLINYNHTDNGPFDYTCYQYRLKVSFIDDSVLYSNFSTLCYSPEIKIYNKLYPNPSIDFIKIAFANVTISSTINAYVYNMLGKTIGHSTAESIPGNDILYIEMQNVGISNGIYILVIYNGEQKIYSGKLVFL